MARCPFMLFSVLYLHRDASLLLLFEEDESSEAAIFNSLADL